MKKLKKFQKFALSTEQASKVRGGLTCWVSTGSEDSGNYLMADFPDTDEGDDNAAGFCAGQPGCVGCF